MFVFKVVTTVMMVLLMISVLLTQFKDERNFITYFFIEVIYVMALFSIWG